MIDLALCFYTGKSAGNVFILNLSTSACSTEICSACFFEIFINFCCCIMFSYRSLAIFSQVSVDPIPKKEKGINWIIIYTFKYKNSTQNQLSIWKKCWWFITIIDSGILITFKETYSWVKKKKCLPNALQISFLSETATNSSRKLQLRV